MASVKKGVPAARSLPVDVEKFPEAPFSPKSFHSQHSEMSDFTSLGQVPSIRIHGDSASDSGEDFHYETLQAEQASLVSTPDQHRSYGATKKLSLDLPPRRRPKRKKRYSTASVLSIARVCTDWAGLVAVLCM